METINLFFTKISPVMIFIIMIGLGLSLTVADLKRVVVFPKAALIGFTGQLIMLPALAFALVELFNPLPVVAVGLIVLAACPGGVTSNTYVFAARGDIALSVTLTAISSMITVFTIPLFITIAAGLYLDTEIRADLSFLSMMKSLALMTMVPVLIGMAVRHYRTAFALRCIEPVRKLALFFIIVLLGGSIILSLRSVWDTFMDAALIACLLNVITMSIGYGAARLFRLTNAQVVSITYEIGVQNLSLALTVSLAILQQPVMALTALIYGIFMKITAIGFLFYARKLTSEAEDTNEVAGAGPARDIN